MSTGTTQLSGNNVLMFPTKKLLHYKHMSNALLALFVAAGVAGLAYSKLGKRVGYGNQKNVWTLVAISFIISYIVVFLTINTLLDL